jgi:peroxiredoxin
VLGISVDSFASANHFCEHMELKFPLLGDWPRYEVGKAYGVFSEERSFHSRVTFVIDTDGIVRARIDERDPLKHAPLALAAVRELGKG